MQQDMIRDLKRVFDRSLFLVNTNFDAKQEFLKNEINILFNKFNLESEKEKILKLITSDIDDKPLNESTQFLREFYTEIGRKDEYTLAKLAEEVEHPAFLKWRRRQVSRCISEVSYLEKVVYHGPFAIELCKGCSVGCWFCGVNAPKLSEKFIFNEVNEKLFSGILNKLKSVFGVATRTGLLYWASDPFDNEDYEKFCQTFFSITGGFPITTTAKSNINIERTRKFIKLANDTKVETVIRFSILSKVMGEKILKELTLEETKKVILLPMFKGGALMSGAGRALQKLNDRAEEIIEVDTGLNTIACVSGFLINLCEKSIKLISPCPASQEWPLGYRIFYESKFSSLADFENCIDEAVSKVAALGVESLPKIKFRNDLRIERVDKK